MPSASGPVRSGLTPLRTAIRGGTSGARSYSCVVGATWDGRGCSRESTHPPCTPRIPIFPHRTPVREESAIIQRKQGVNNAHAHRGAPIHPSPGVSRQCASADRWAPRWWRMVQALQAVDATHEAHLCRLRRRLAEVGRTLDGRRPPSFDRIWTIFAQIWPNSVETGRFRARFYHIQ